MSRNLPESPNLEYLKKQAKVRLRELQQHEPRAKLAEAQHLVAREYGFASWTKLKTHIETLPRPAMTAAAGDAGGSHGGGGATTTGIVESNDSGGGLFPRFTLRARRVIFFARYWAAKRGGTLIETEHLLLGLIQEDANQINWLLGDPAAHEKVRGAIERSTTTQEEIPRTQPIPLSPDSRRVLELAAAEADRLGHNQIATGHFLLGFLRTEGSLAMSVLVGVLAERGLTLDKARSEIALMVNEEPQT